jgi:hypothetical protein
MMGDVVRGGVGLIEEPLAAVSLDGISYAAFSNPGSGASRQRLRLLISTASKLHSFIIRP